MKGPRIIVTGVTGMVDTMTGTDEGRECTKCGTFKPWSEFYRHASGFMGYASECKPCRRAYDATVRDRRNAYSREWRARRDPAVKHREQVRYRLGVSDEWYEEQTAKQAGLCASCGKPETRVYKGRVRMLSVDHDHQTGEHRALLCNSCNRTIGFANEDADRLEACAAYLRKFK